jgi:hypothetical protein
MALEHHSRLLSALARGMTLEEEALHIAQMQAAAAAAAAATRTRCQQQDAPEQAQQPTGGAEGTVELQETGGGTAGNAALAASAGRSMQQDVFENRFLTDEDVLQVRRHFVGLQVKGAKSQMRPASQPCCIRFLQLC